MPIRDVKFKIKAEDRTGRAFQSVQTQLATTTRSLRRFSGALGAVAGFAGLAQVARQTLNFADEVGKLSTRLGASTEFLSELNFAAKQSGVEFNAATTALQRLTRRTSEAAQGTGEAVKAFDELGISAAELNRQSPDQQFRRIITALRGVENQSDRVRLAFKFFDTEGVKLLQLVDGFEELTEQARDLGVTLDEQTVQKAEAAKDALGQLQAVGQGVAQSFLGTLAPALTTTANAMTQLTQNIIEFNQTDTSKWFKFVQPIAGLPGSGGFEVLSRVLKNRREFLEELEKIQTSPDGGPRRGGRRGRSAVIAPNEEKVIDRAADSAKRLADSMSKFAAIPETQYEQPITSMEELQHVLDGTIDGAERLPPAMKEATEQMSEYAIAASRNIQGAFADFLFDPFEDGLKGLLKNFVDVLRRMAAEAASAQFFASPVGAGLLGFFGLPGRASGGPVTAGQPYVVGERGAELFVPQTSGRIIANGKAGGGQVQVVHNIDARGADPALANRLPEILERNRRATVVEILDMQRRGRWPI